MPSTSASSDRLAHGRSDLGTCVSTCVVTVQEEVAGSGFSLHHFAVRLLLAADQCAACPCLTRLLELARCFFVVIDASLPTLSAAERQRYARRFGCLSADVESCQLTLHNNHCKHKVNAAAGELTCEFSVFSVAVAKPHLGCWHGQTLQSYL